MPDGRAAAWSRGCAVRRPARIVRRAALPTADLSIRKLARGRGARALRQGRARRCSTASRSSPTCGRPRRCSTGGACCSACRASPDRDARLAEAEQILRARLNFQGTTMGFSTERDRLSLVADGLGRRATRVRLVLPLVDAPALAATTCRGWCAGALAPPAPRGLGHDGRQCLGRARGREVLRAPSRATPVDRHDDRDARRACRARSTGPDAEGRALALPWPAGRDDVAVEQEGTGTPWVTVQARAAIPLKAPLCRAATASPDA